MRRLFDDESGQAMAEYAIVVASVTGVLVGAGFTFLPDFINALQRYYDSYYIILNLPIP
jgi:Flp pilus assembly pilin Flp